MTKRTWWMSCRSALGLYASFLKGQGHQGILPLVKGTIWGKLYIPTFLAFQEHHGNNLGAWRQSPSLPLWRTRPGALPELACWHDYCKTWAEMWIPVHKTIASWCATVLHVLCPPKQCFPSHVWTKNSYKFNIYVTLIHNPGRQFTLSFECFECCLFHHVER